MYLYTNYNDKTMTDILGVLILATIAINFIIMSLLNRNLWKK